MVRLMLIGFAVSTLSSCMWMATTPSGIRAMTEHNSSLATVGEQDSPHYELRRLEEQQKTLRVQLQAKGE